MTGTVTSGRVPIAVAISGRGSNLRALAAACAADDYPAEICLVVSNRPDAAGLAFAREAGLETAVLDHRAAPDRAAYDEALDRLLRKKLGDDGLVCLAGFMRILTDSFVDAWRGRLLNIHPSLLPLFKGLHPQQQALDAGVGVSGCTVHYVTPEMDSGPIIAQAAVPVRAGDNADVLENRILNVEHRLYPWAVSLVATGAVRWDGAGPLDWASPVGNQAVEMQWDAVCGPVAPWQ